jgi:hypothetical protein
MKVAFMLISLLLAGWVLPNTAVADEINGKWVDGEQVYSYTFHEDQRFECTGQDYDWDEKKNKPSSADGVWKKTHCWLGEEDEGRSGNILVYVDDFQCCLHLEVIASKLAITKIWPDKDGGKDDCGFCSNRLLGRPSLPKN